MLVEHMHLRRGAPADSTYIEAAEAIKTYAWADVAGYHSLADREADIQADAEKLRKAIEKWSK
jgi:hypothetical protein